MLVYVLFIIGFIILIKGADLLIKGASSIAKRNRISDLVIGLTIVSLGTSLPELVINVFASITGNSSIAIGNIFGSNIANVLLILGLSAVFSPLALKKSTIYSEIPFALIATLLVGFLANASLFHAKPQLFISRYDGIILMFFFLLFMLYIFRIAKHSKEDTIEETGSLITQRKSLVFILAGMVMLFFGGTWVVDGAIEIAGALGLSEALIGLTIVAVGTSLPELVTSVVAAAKKNADIAVGNVVGSNIFNILWVLGLSAVIKPMPFNIINNLDVFFMVFSLVVIILAVIARGKSQIVRTAGIIFLLLYVAYVVFLVYRG